MRTRIAWRKICWSCLLHGAIFLASVVTPVAVMRYIDREPSVQIDAISVAGDVSVAQGRINVRSHFDKLHYCDTDVGRYLYRDEMHDGLVERVIVPLTSTATSLTGIGPDQHIVISLDVPQHLASGRWYYYAVGEDRCGFFSRLQVRRTPDIPLDLVTTE